MAKTTKKTIANKTTKKPTSKVAVEAAAVPMPEALPPKTSANKSSDKKVDIAAYWTPERRRAATLHPALRAKKQKPKTKAKVKGDPTKVAKPIRATKRAAAALATYETSLVPNAHDFPASTIGKIYMTVNGNDHHATGWVVGNRCVFTVASALWNGDTGWASNVVFYPQYNNGPASGLGAFQIVELWVAAGWQENGGLLNDFGALITAGPIAPYTGSVGLMANYPINQGQYLVMGYPGSAVPGYAFDGERMWQSTSAYLSDFAWIIQAGGNMTYGAHGAPWLIFREGGWYANGMFAVQVVDPDSMLSPYFGNEVWAFYTHLRDKGYV